MRIVILIFILVFVAFIVLFAVPVRFRQMLQRLIDHAISKSVFRQLSFLVIATGLSFGSLLLLIWLNYGRLKLNILDWLFAYINPGSFFSSNGIESSDRIWAIVSGIIGMIFLGGLLISVICNIIERRVDRVKNGNTNYYFKNHVVIIGYDRMSIGLICQLAKDERFRNSEIILLTTQEAPKVHHELFSGLESEIEKKVTIVSGNRTTVEDLKRLHINQCKEVFILGENDEYDNDSLNVECIKKIHNILSEKSSGGIIRCNVLFEYQSTFTVFQRQDIDRIKDRIDFVPFSYYEMWAQKILVDGEYESAGKGVLSGKIEYMPLDREGIDADSDKKVQLVVINMSRMGVALGVQAAHLCHFPNFVTKGIKTRITFIDENADAEMNFMRGCYRHLFNEVDVFYREINRSDMMNCNIMKGEGTRIHTCDEKEIFTDVEFEFIRARVEYPAIQDYLARLSCDSNICLTVAVCFSFPPQALASGLYLPDELYNNHIPVLVRQEISYCTLDMLAKDGQYKNVKPFGMLENCYDLGKADDRIPMMVNYVYNRGIPEKFPEKEMVAMWRLLRTALQWSNRYNANSVRYKMRSFNNLCLDMEHPLNDEQVELMAKVEHNRWNIEKLLMGYRATTPFEKEEIAKNPSKKNELKINRYAHNDICRYEDLQVDETGTNVRDYDRFISKSLPLIIRTDERLQKYAQKICQNKPTV